MRSTLILFLLTTLFLATNCGLSPNSQLATVHQSTGDIQVLSSQSLDNLCFRFSGGPQNCSGYKVIKPHIECQEISRKVEATYSMITFDCTKAASAQFGVPALQQLVVTGRKYNDRPEIQYGTYYWIQKVRAVIRNDALRAETFRGIGFYANQISFSLSNSGPRPGPNGADIGQFIPASSLKVEESVTLKDGSAGTVLSFLTFVRMSDGGSSGAYGVYFKLYAKFFSDGEEYWNWDLVTSEYFVDWRSQFNRTGDVLR